MRILNREQVVSHGFEEGRRIVPLRYNYDKPEKPRRIKA